ncbi:Xylose isomerase domain-containing protein TIM barrel [Candidatus Sulfopaludibacter sp. SbA3]|nr:Xylose isomerase domain-containing protein TIM barrel [Candidatus Sulfopaludibacter sp. SbA3]
MSPQHLDRRAFLKTASALIGTSAFGLSPQARSPKGSRNRAQLQFSLAHLTVLGCAPPEMTYIAARAGYDFVSYRTITMHLPNEPDYNLAANQEMLRQTKTALAVTGIKVHDIELARIQGGVSPKAYVPALETAAELGARQVITSIWTPDRAYAIESLTELCDLGKKFGLTMNLEFVTWSNVATLKDAVSVCRAVNRENLGLLIDMLHFNRSRTKLEELDELSRGWCHFVHVCDAPKEIPESNEGLIHTAREERFYPGEGGIDIASIVNRLPEVPYSLEIPNLARVKEVGYAEHAWRCLEAAKKYFSNHPRL